jgi:RNA polymerase sigma factor (TIGR02999 family)
MWQIRVGAMADGSVTELLGRARAGDRDALAAVFPLVYDELRRIAAARVRGQGASPTLQTTALVHEAYLRLMEGDAPWESRAHFFHVAASAMRSILIDHARARKAAKRGGNRRREPFHEALAWFEEQRIDLVDLGDALEDLGKEEPRKKQLVELRFFAGLTSEEASEVLGISIATAERDWTLARAWLRKRMSA